MCYEVRARGHASTAQVSRKTQKISFNPNWICREEVAVEMINPADELTMPDENTVAFGVP